MPGHHVGTTAHKTTTELCSGSVGWEPTLHGVLGHDPTRDLIVAAMVAQTTHIQPGTLMDK